MMKGDSYKSSNLYHVHYNMTQRKDVKVCPEWKDYKKFAEWCFKNGYKDGSRIIRIDKTKPYSPENSKITTSDYSINMKRLIGLTKNKNIKHIKFNYL